MKFLKQFIDERKKNNVKKYWEKKTNPCKNTDKIFDALEVDYRDSMKKVLEFGCSWGGNLKYFMDKISKINTVGVDINSDVLKLSKDYPNFTGIVGDENALFRFADNEFDLAFTISVLDHIPFDYVVEGAIDQLLRVSRRVILLEPFIEGVCGDVSSKTRDSVRPDLPKGYKKFALYSYLWDYDKILDKKSVDWQKKEMPLHQASLGPFYHLYVINSGKHET